MKQAFSIGTVVALQLFTTLFTQLFVMRIVGLGPDTDAYIAAQTIPSVVIAIITSSLQSVWLPRLSIMTGDLVAWRQEQSIAQGQAGLLGGGLLLFVGGGLPLWLPLLFPGFNSIQKQAAMFYCIVMLVAAAFNTQSAILTIALRARNRFMAAEVIALSGTLLSLGAMYFALPLWGLTAAVWIGLARSVLVYGAQMSLANWPPLSFKKGWSCKETWILMRPLLFGASIYKTSPMVDRYWASQSTAGSITAMSLAQTAMGALASIFERAICIPIIPSLARLVEQSDYVGLRHTYKRSILKITLAVVIFAILLLMLKPIFVVLIKSILNTNNEVASNLWLVLFLLIGYLHVAASGTVVVATFYAMGNTKTPVKIGVIGFCSSVFIKSFGYLFFGLNGLVIGTSIYYMGNMIIMCIFLEKIINEKLSR
jgi:peptidoglycan biosynthesis protein MviN/MurJ (putative lipid II flippase)